MKGNLNQKTEIVRDSLVQSLSNQLNALRWLKGPYMSNQAETHFLDSSLSKLKFDQILEFLEIICLRNYVDKEEKSSSTWRHH